jgi:protein-L-isoaspartate(D-aspartate) O-methyltransferase
MARRISTHAILRREIRQPGRGAVDRESELRIVRRAYAKHVMAAAGVVDGRVEAAFAAVPREHFLGPGPWPILRWGRGYEATPTADPVYLYDDVLVGIIPERRLNNGPARSGRGSRRAIRALSALEGRVGL